ncbi:ribonuclease H1 [Pelomyxa schiedti]|nr:ribonuclease H1 [Pelomyxa schiedti]
MSGSTQEDLVLYADGSCKNNGKKVNLRAGVGVFHEEYSSLNVCESWSESLGQPTNQRAELVAAIRAIQKAKAKAPLRTLEIRTDSVYVVNGMKQWIKNWKKNGWQSASRAPVCNKDLWQTLDALASDTLIAKNIVWTHCAGHSGIYGNEMANKLANDAADQSAPSAILEPTGHVTSPLPRSNSFSSTTTSAQSSPVTPVRLTISAPLPALPTIQCTTKNRPSTPPPSAATNTPPSLTPDTTPSCTATSVPTQPMPLGKRERPFPSPDVTVCTEPDSKKSCIQIQIVVSTDNTSGAITSVVPSVTQYDL